MAKIGVLLTGCGRLDGSDIHEAVLALVSIEKGDQRGEVGRAAERDRTGVGERDLVPGLVRKGGRADGVAESTDRYGVGAGIDLVVALRSPRANWMPSR